MALFKNDSITIPYNDKSVEALFDLLFEYIYYNVSLSYDKMAEQLSYDRRKSAEFNSSIKTVLNFVKHNAIVFKPGNSDCIYHYDINNDDFTYSSENCDVKIDFDTELFHKRVIEKGPKSIMINGIKKLTVVNNYGINDDVNGTRGLDWILNFYPSYTVYQPKGISLDDLIIACYKTKSHKFENIYENVHSICDYEINVEHLVIELDVDHSI